MWWNYDGRPRPVTILLLLILNRLFHAPNCCKTQWHLKKKGICFKILTFKILTFLRYKLILVLVCYFSVNCMPSWICCVNMKTKRMWRAMYWGEQSHRSSLISTVRPRGQSHILLSSTICMSSLPFHLLKRELTTSGNCWETWILLHQIRQFICLQPASLSAAHMSALKQHPRPHASEVGSLL